MSSHQDWFQTYSQLDTPCKVWLGDNTFILAHGIGCIPIHMHADHKWNQVILQDVLHVPDLHGNLLSMSALMQRGAHVHFAAKTCKIHDKNDVLTCIGHLKDNLYILDARMYVHDTACIAQVDNPKLDSDFSGSEMALRAHSQMATADVWLWHHHLGHLNVDSVIKMAHKGMVNGMTITGDTMRNAVGTCKPCIKGKHAQHTIEKQTDTCTNAILGHVFSDLCGPMQTRLHEGYEYFATFIDDKS